MLYGVSTDLHIMDGEYDHHLKWPLEEKVIITLLNKQTDDQHHRIEKYFKSTKGSKLLLRDANVNVNEQSIVKHEYEQLLKLTKAEPGQLVNKLWSM